VQLHLHFLMIRFNVCSYVWHCFCVVSCRVTLFGLGWYHDCCGTGNTPNVIRQAGTASINFMLMDWYKGAMTPMLRYTTLQERAAAESGRTLGQRKRGRSLLSSFLSGGLAGGTTTTILYPVEFMRTRLAMDIGGPRPETRLYPRGMRDVFLQTYRLDGIRGLYQGYGVALGGVVLYRALHLGGYDALKSEVLRYKHDSSQSYTTPNEVGQPDDPPVVLSFGERFAAAQTVSIVAGTMCYPIDSVRRRLMMQAGKSIDVKLYRNSLDCFRIVWKTEGMRGFFLGIGPNIVRSFGGAILLVAYDSFKDMIP
jgi:solute carrier family 25 (adenine nucleotide translocator) protein 4/5/6/31